MTQRIATSPLTGRIQIGRLNANNTAFVGQTRDVTSEVIGAIVEKARFHGGSFEIANRAMGARARAIYLDGIVLPDGKAMGEAA